MFGNVCLTPSNIALFGFSMVILLFGNQPAFTQLNSPPEFEQLSLADGLSQSSVSAIKQDSMGFLWFGTNDGLNKYDGRAFTVFRHDPEDPYSISNNTVTSIAKGRGNVLWIGTMDGVLNRLDLATEQFQRFTLDAIDSLNLGFKLILDIYEDQQGIIWSCLPPNGLIRLDPTSGATSLHQHKPGDPSSLSSNAVMSTMEDRQGNLWISSFSGLNRLIMDNPQNPQAQKQFQRYYPMPENPQSPDNRIGRIIEDKHGQLWMNAGSNLYNFDPSTKIFKKTPYPFPTPFRTGNSIVKDQKENLWITWGSRLFRYNLELQQLDHIKPDPSVPYSLSDTPKRSCFIDQENVLWVGTFSEGLNKYSSWKRKFQHLLIDEPNPNINNIYSILKDSKGKVWIGSEGGLHCWEPATGNFTHYYHHPDDPKSLSNNLVRSIFEDSKRQLWVGTISGLNRFDSSKGSFQHFLNPAGQGVNFISDIIEIDEGQLWLETQNGLIQFNPETKKFLQFLPGSENIANPISSTFKTHNGKIWVATTKGTLYLFDPESSTLQVHLQNTFITDLFEDKNKDLWIAKSGEGLFRYDPINGLSRVLSAQDGLANGTIYEMLEDDRGRLWLSTNSGLTRFDPSTKKVRNYYPEDGLQDFEFNRGAVYQDPQTGNMYFGGINGVNIFFPDSVLDNTYIPSVAISRFWHYPDDRDSLSSPVEEKGIAYKKNLKLPYWDNILTFEVTAFSFSNPDNNRYAYRLEGFSDQWIQLGTKREFTFTNLSPGDYTLQVKGSNGDGIWNPVPTELNIRITPPWYWSWWSKIIYFLATFAGIYHFYRFQLNRRLAQAETKRLQELDQVKTQLYTNITHEFRTPLTIIQGVTDQIASEADVKKEWNIQSNAQIVKRNSGQLLSLVNQMLDLRKLESGNLPVNLIQGDIIIYLKYLLESFQSLAESKDIRLHFLSRKKAIWMDYDPEKIRHIVANLLSNAVKFTPDGGDVYVTVDGIRQTVEGNSLRISIKDTGIGIPADKLPHIFDRFYQIDDKPTRKAEGTGIGLTLTKQLVNLLEGEIRVESEPEAGTTFEVTLPIRNTATSINGTHEVNLSAASATALEVINHRMGTQAVPGTSDLPLALIIEDNQDVAHYIRSCLNSQYAIEMASNGREGIDKAIDLVPNLIISDVMMPEKDGFEVTRTLKNDPHTSHIPIILLTAKADIAFKLQGLERGADAYLPKPFNKDELLIRSRKLLELRQKLQARYLALAGGESPNATLTEASQEQQEDAFVLRVRKVVEDHLNDFDFSVEQLIVETHMSRSQLHRKLSALTGYSATRFIRYIRLNHAKSLLKNPDLAIGNIAYDSGFSDPVYFTRVFKQEFGRTPSEWRENHS